MVGEPRLRHLTPEQGNLLHRLGIEREDPWVLISSDGPVTTEHARFRVDAGDTVLHLPLDARQRKRWGNFEYLAVGVRLERIYALMYAKQYGGVGGPSGALRQYGDDLFVGLRYQRIKPADCALYVEMLYDRSGHDAAIRNVHVSHKMTDRARLWKAVSLLLRYRGRPLGPTPGSEIERWVNRIYELDDERAARHEFYREEKKRPRTERRGFEWWRAAVQHHVPNHVRKR
jgi:hypothetical protein